MLSVQCECGVRYYPESDSQRECMACSGAAWSEPSAPLDPCFVGPAEFDAVFPWHPAEHEPLSPEEWDAGFAHLRPEGWEHADAGDYDAWVASLPKAIPID
jgi:hypothetical protein